MKPKVYIETSVISYLTSRPSRDVVVAGRQQVTRDWWDTQRARFELLVSEAVLNEARAGEDKMAALRLEALRGIPEIELGPEVYELAAQLVRSGPLPEKAVLDSVHIAAAVCAPVDYLLTWNFKHMANVVIRTKIEKALLARGYEPCRICTPEELMEDLDDA